MSRQNSSLSTVLLTLALCQLMLVAQGQSITNCAVHSSSGTVCLSCNTGYILGNSGSTCTKRDCSNITNCNTCDTSSTCVVCDTGYYYNDNRTSCLKYTCVDSSCSLCFSTSTGQCVSCDTSYYVLSNNTC